jgi:DNA-binding NarL/FixJ family response regulator
MVSVAIVEDDVIIRSGLEHFISLQDEEFKLAGAYESAEAFLMRDGNPPDVLILDIELPGKSGLEAVFFIKEKYPDVRILMFTVYEEAERIFKALQAGASGYLLKNIPLLKIKSSILEVVEGGAPMSPVIAKKVVAYFAGLPPAYESKALQQLTPREKEVAELLVEGNTYKEVAAKLFLSTDTIRQHIKNIYRKLQVNSRTKLIQELRG